MLSAGRAEGILKTFLLRGPLWQPLALWSPPEESRAPPRLESAGSQLCVLGQVPNPSGSLWSHLYHGTHDSAEDLLEAPEPSLLAKQSSTVVHGNGAGGEVFLCQAPGPRSDFTGRGSSDEKPHFRRFEGREGVWG